MIAEQSASGKEQRKAPPPVPPIPISGEDVLTTASDLYFSRHGEKVLIVEPESASWGILLQSQWRVFRRIVRGNELEDRWDYWATLQNVGQGVKVKEIRYNDFLSSRDFHSLLQFLYRKNIIAVNGEQAWDPVSLWKVQAYPHYINVHVTEGCNLGCKYCRVYSLSKAPQMSPDLAEKIVRRVVTEIPSNNFLFGPHGGEPMSNLDAVLKIARVGQEMGRATRKIVRTVMQTNGTFLRNHDHCKELLDAGVQVGVSLDGPQEIHNANRVFHDGRGSFKEVMQGVETAKKIGLKLGFLAVVHNPNDYVKILDFFSNELGEHSVRINYAAKEGRGKDILEFSVDRAESFARGWLEMIDYALDFRKKTGVWLDIADVNLFVYHLLSKERPHMCYRSPCGIGNSIMGVSYDGSLYLCDELVGNDLYKFGHINESINLKEMLDSSSVVMETQMQRRIENIPKCSTCVWRRFHGGPCTSKTVAYYGRIQDDPMCRYYHVIFEKLMWRIHEEPEITALVGHYGRRLKAARAAEANLRKEREANTP